MIIVSKTDLKAILGFLEQLEKHCGSSERAADRNRARLIRILRAKLALKSPPE